MQHSKLLYEKGILHNLKMLTQSQYSNFKFVARLDQIKTLTAGIKSLTFGEYGAFMVNEDGFTCTVEQGKCIQASLFLMPACFSEFHVDGVVHFNINMNVLNECLSIFSGIDCSLKMFYKGPEAPLVIVLEPKDESDISTECSIKTMLQDEIMEYALDENSSSLNVLFIRGPELMTIFQEFDKSTEELEITISPRRPHFKIDTLGVMQSESSIEVAKTSDMILMFNCRETTKARYKSSLIRLTQKALSVSSKVAIKTDLSGLMEMHFMLQDSSEAEIYIQFFITPMADIEM
ncbi:cell cycle checkpoint protein RAD1 [Stomoxys calcitrans]|uniref:cell cycle checkpoint protein RAD1 n=1 Tax=Stomoxys calcitrans TaxID=35570 RepID=UPI0027E28BC7|nr:cell cycle checkpoint protein RAD1 [Stomoxys calcitrans]